MKSIHFSFFILLFALIGCNGDDAGISSEIVKNPVSAEGNTNEPMPTMEFENELFEFGTISQGQKVTHDFKFTNKGKADLVINTAKGSCGCTVPEWPMHPIKPGESAVIKVVFDSDGKSGRQHKKVSIIANTQPSTNLIAISGEVVAPN